MKISIFSLYLKEKGGEKESKCRAIVVSARARVKIIRNVSSSTIFDREIRATRADPTVFSPNPNAKHDARTHTG